MKSSTKYILELLLIRAIAQAYTLTIIVIIVIFNPRRMREGYGSHFVSVCVCLLPS